MPVSLTLRLKKELLSTSSFEFSATQFCKLFQTSAIEVIDVPKKNILSYYLSIICVRIGHCEQYRWHANRIYFIINQQGWQRRDASPEPELR